MGLRPRDMQQQFAEDEPFVSASNTPAGPQPIHVARQSESCAISVNPVGSLRWSGGDLDGDHLICVVSERAPSDYLAMLPETSISYIVVGESSVDLVQAVSLLGEPSGIRTLLLEGGGHINSGFLEAGLIDEVGLLLVPGIEGRHDVAAVFDGVAPSNHTAVPLRVKSVDEREGDAQWIRYEVVRP